MITKIARFFTFLSKENTRRFLSFALYSLFIFTLIPISLPPAWETFRHPLFMSILILGFSEYLVELSDSVYEKIKGKLKEYTIIELKKIGKELLMYIPIWIISSLITSFLANGKSQNQIFIEESFYDAPIFKFILLILIGPIIEEFIFRVLPSRFIKNKTLYVIISAFIFAAMHVVGDPNAFHYIWFYLLRSLYYSYSFYKTQDILVPISMHSLNNLISTLLFIFS